MSKKRFTAEDVVREADVYLSGDWLLRKCCSRSAYQFRPAIAGDKAELPKTRFHDLRHTFATRLVQIGVDLYKVQKLMRHKSPMMTRRYAHHYPESLRDGVETLDRISIISAQSTKEKGAAGITVTPSHKQ